MVGTGKLALVLILGTLTALGPLSMDMYLPALPHLGRDLGASASQAQLTLSACILGLALGQLVIGPWSDAVGRRRPLFSGLGLYVAASLACAAAPTIEILVAARFLQGLGGAAALVTCMAVTRDRYTGIEAARFFSLLMLVMGLAPILAPVIGAQVLLVASWHAVFVVLAVAAVAVGSVAYKALGESLPPERRNSGGIGHAFRTFPTVLADRLFVGYAMAGGLSFSAMFAYIAGSPFVLQHIHGLTPQEFGIVFGVNALGLIGASQVNGLLVHRVAPRRMMLVGLVGAALAGMLLLAVAVFDGPLELLLAGLFLVAASQGLVAPNTAALALALHGRTAGAASALLGASRFVLGAVVAPLVGIAGETSSLPMALVIAATTLGGLTICLMTDREAQAPKADA